MFQDDQQFWFDTLRHLGLAVHGGSDVRDREADGHRRIGCGLPLRCPWIEGRGTSASMDLRCATEARAGAFDALIGFESWWESPPVFVPTYTEAVPACAALRDAKRQRGTTPST
ncbi:hypothetical protein SAMN05428945_5028 [Streptomyces sp. 2224.1]|nr:hypothetical protein SAMN05428945_5028 [Streptomyces sp. 2224.1]